MDINYVVVGNQVTEGAYGVQNTCFPSGTGGYANDVGGRFSIGVVNNPNYNPSGSKRTTPKLTPLANTKRADGVSYLSRLQT
jgi:hypothetical protein